MTATPYRILGALGSPYSLKMRAVMRYRRLPHVWIQLDPDNDFERTRVKAPVIPVIQYPDGGYHNDSTPMIYDLERRHAERPVVPADAGDAFLSFLLEDMADEWGTKFMFHYRWFAERDQKQMSEWLAYDRFRGGEARIRQFAAAFRERQVGRMAIVGCTPENAPVIEHTLRRLAAILERHVLTEPYFFGTCPSLAEFAWYGQLSQLIVDPTPNDLMREIAPFTVRWLMQMDDASGVEGEWRPGTPAAVVDDLLAFAGDIYLPFLAANARAVAAGEPDFALDLPGGRWSQGSFKYQAKCLEALRQAWAALPSETQGSLGPLLDRTGCLPFLAGDEA
ncbi:glutathione S-transferase N-terminal domain-containing protein [Phenylobacterium sp. VNQ135]|uniref:glutathione S-transferase N-terminal domain-containing protein n=1 Tax=Phenylobacterium sp. VNQ135 TaxID=3400922 RepID=UPI003C0344CF